ncbi:uncharacterized protein LOC115989033 [Quercus lobata]|uniref:uncharacterized protein LOC115989033 n=1 Tax=Quercus lobata TaxID=97700 RepID=UPI00124884F3|nr:uncharacterized protein LOC115989033 [Quercus lobata]
MAKDATGNITGWGVERQALGKGRDKLSCYCSHVIATGNAPFLFLTWLSLKLQHNNSRFSPPTLARAQRTLNHHDNEDDAKAEFDGGVCLFTGGAVTCASLHLGEIRPGALRGNHRHHTRNETLVIWGAKTKYRLENSQVVGEGYAEVIIDADEVAVAASPSGTAHALVTTVLGHSKVNISFKIRSCCLCIYVTKLPLSLLLAIRV